MYLIYLQSIFYEHYSLCCSQLFFDAIICALAAIAGFGHPFLLDKCSLVKPSACLILSLIEGSVLFFDGCLGIQSTIVACHYASYIRSWSNTNNTTYTITPVGCMSCRGYSTTHGGCVYWKQRPAQCNTLQYNYNTRQNTK